MKVAVVGAGASGLFVSGFLAENGHSVTVFDKNEKVGKKLYISGKGRCNITNLCDSEEFLSNVVRGQKFLHSALYGFTPQDTIDFFNELGLSTKVERGNRVFPMSDKSSDVIKVLKEKHCKNVNFCLDCEVKAISKDFAESMSGDVSTALNMTDGGAVEDTHSLFIVTTEKGKERFDRVIIATGGKSYKATGSDGAGFKFAKMFGHTIIPLVPALCPLKLKDWFVKKLQGVSLKNVQLDVVADNKRQSYFGEMLFTDEGITGPIVLTTSSYINRSQNVTLSLDLKPALSEQQLEARLLRDFEDVKNKELKSVFRGLLPKVVAEVFAKVIGVDDNKKVNSVTKEERLKIVEGLKNFPLEFAGFYDMDAGIVTSGGVDTKEINPKTFESKLVNGLYFLGEVLDVDALTGGFNLQICWASSYSCAKNFD